MAPNNGTINWVRILRGDVKLYR